MAATVSIGSAGARDAATQRAGAYRYIKRGLDVGDDLPEVLSARPGITGFWQAYARNDATWESGERQRMELYYVRNISAGLDARIFFRSFGAIFGLTGK